MTLHPNYILAPLGTNTPQRSPYVYIIRVFKRVGVVSNAISDMKPLQVALGYGPECDLALESNPSVSVLWYLHTFIQTAAAAARNRDTLEDRRLNF